MNEEKKLQDHTQKKIKSMQDTFQRQSMTAAAGQMPTSQRQASFGQKDPT
jgi:hypothetical protein